MIVWRASEGTRSLQPLVPDSQLNDSKTAAYFEYRGSERLCSQQTNIGGQLNMSIEDPCNKSRYVYN